MLADTVFDKLQTWDEIVTFGLDLRADRDERTWALGALAAYACPENPDGGRPANGSKEHTLSALARALREQPAAMSAWYWNYKFWGDRWKLSPDVSWRQFSEARRRCGWRPGVEITDLHRQRAEQLLAAMDEPTRPPDPRPAWRRRLDRACDILAAIAADPETPALVALAVRTLIGQVMPE